MAAKRETVEILNAEIPEVETPDSRDLMRRAERIVSYYSKWGGGAGLIPVPFLDVAAIAGVQLNMLARLSELYGVPFETNRARVILMTVLGTVAPGSLALGAAGAAIRAVPVLGSVLSVLTLPAFAAASTYAVGSVFTTHLATGGSLFDVDIDDMKEAVSKEFASRTARAAQGS